MTKRKNESEQKVHKKPPPTEAHAERLHLREQITSKNNQILDLLEPSKIKIEELKKELTQLRDAMKRVEARLLLERVDKAQKLVAQK